MKKIMLLALALQCSLAIHAADQAKKEEAATATTRESQLKELLTWLQQSEAIMAPAKPNINKAQYEICQGARGMSGFLYFLKLNVLTALKQKEEATNLEKEVEIDRQLTEQELQNLDAWAAKAETVLAPFKADQTKIGEFARQIDPRAYFLNLNIQSVLPKQQTGQPAAQTAQPSDCSDTVELRSNPNAANDKKSQDAAITQRLIDDFSQGLNELSWAFENAQSLEHLDQLVAQTKHGKYAPRLHPLPKDKGHF